MSDLYTELLVKKEQTTGDRVKKYGLIALTVVFVFAGLFVHPIVLLAALASGIACYFVLPTTDLEYEYLFVNGEMDIDTVMSKTKRKKAFSFSLSEADLCAPVNSHRMDYYNGNQRMKVYDYSSGNPEHFRMAVILRKNNETCRVIIEPDEHLAGLMKNSAPSKVFLD